LGANIVFGIQFPNTPYLSVEKNSVNNCLCLFFRIEPQLSKLQELDNDELKALKRKETEVN
jgi:hypothetical protein